MISKIIKEEFEKKIKEVFIGRHEIISFILNHPNREKCFEKVHHEIIKAEMTRPGMLSDEIIRMLSHNYALIFAQQALNAKEKEIISESEKIKQKKEQDEFNYIQKRMEQEIASDHSEF